MFIGTRGDGYYGDIAVDDISIKTCLITPLCNDKDFMCLETPKCISPYMVRCHGFFTFVPRIELKTKANKKFIKQLFHP